MGLRPADAVRLLLRRRKTMQHHFCGWIGSSGQDPQTLVAKMFRAAYLDHQPAACPTVHLLGEASAVASTESSAIAAAGAVAMLVGHCRWFDSQLRDRAAEHGEAQALLLAYQRYGKELCGHVRGEFAFAVWDPKTQALILATDHFGIRPLYYATTGTGIVFATGLRSLIAHSLVTAEIDPQALYDYLYFHCIPGPRTIYRDVRKLMPAQALTWTSHDSTADTYWLPQTENCSVDADREALAAELRSVVRGAVRAHSQAAGDPGAFLSGGLDSSTVAGYLSEITGGSCRTFTIGFSKPEYDESAFARTSAVHFGTEHHELFVSPADVVAAAPRIAAFFEQPFGNSSAVPVYFCAKLARDCGTTSLLAGDGGDELFAGNERYAMQYLFELFFRLPKPARWLLESAYDAVPQLKTLPLIRKGHRYIEQAKIGLPDRLQRYNFMHRFEVRDVLTPELVAQVDTNAPLESLRRRYHEIDASGSLERLLYLDWKFTLADNDLVKVSRMCELADVEVSYPMLDDAVVDLSVRIPATWKMPGRRLRAFFKYAMRDFLPRGTLTKRKHGFGLPFGVWLREDAGLRRLAEESLASLKSRRIVQPAFIDHALVLHQNDTARYYGELVWILMMLELWLAKNT